MRRARPHYSVRRFNPQRKFTTRPGLLTPFLHEEVVAGDIIKLREVVLTKTEAMLAPLQHDLVMKTYYCFIPNRILMKDWKEFRTGNSVTENGTYGQNKVTGEFTLHPMRDKYGFGSVPSTVFDSDVLSWDYMNNHLNIDYGDMTVRTNVTNPASGVTLRVQFDALTCLLPQPDIHSLGDYFQLPQFPLAGVQTESSGNTVDLTFGADHAAYGNAPNLSWFLGYWLFYNEFMRDPDLQDPVPLAPAKSTSLEDLRDYNYLANERVSAVSGKDDEQYYRYYLTLQQFAVDHSSTDLFVGGSIHFLNAVGGNLAIVSGGQLLDAIRPMLGSRLAYGKINPLYPAFINYERDYFTGAKPFDIRGVEPLLPMSGTADFDNLSYSLSNLSVSQAEIVNKEALTDANGTSFPAGSLYAYADRYSLSAGEPHRPLELAGLQGTAQGLLSNGSRLITAPQTVSGTGTATGSSTAEVSVALNLNELKLAQRLQNYLTRLAFTGERYQDFLMSLFGVAPTNRELQRPQFLGGSRSPVLVQEVTQTAPTDNSFLGDLAGKAHGVHSGYIGTLRANEDGFIMGFYVCYPRLEWNPQGVDKKYLHRNRYDYFNQMFDHIPPQPVEVRELYLRPESEQSEEDGEKTFGYRQAWDYLRNYQNKSVAGFRDEFDFWTLARKLDVSPTLNGRFIQMDCARDNLSRPFSVQTGDTIKVFTENSMSIFRQISNTSIPEVR